MHSASKGDNLNEMSNPVFWELEKYHQSVDLAQGVVKGNL